MSTEQCGEVVPSQVTDAFHGNVRSWIPHNIVRIERIVPATWSVRPVQAALSSAASFAVGAALPLVVTALSSQPSMVYWVGGTSLLFLALLGVLATRVGGASVVIGAARVTFWGALAMAITAGVGALFGTII